MTVYNKTADTRPTAGLLDEWMVEWHDHQDDSSVHRNIDQHQVIRTLMPELHPSKALARGTQEVQPLGFFTVR
ncbi:uncharacterized protein PgNI_07548 [Pyricularia grisea]|uniref:Uncharacterized protein n=1 Tax=Pyricularia grisea TaxID=148305 RepID=A0A6P8B2W1_PYRGI|nr:uncharacterized protein PgNI_07548 [Pyricularia grisea]TLD09206.1 hypothetical protein PgNI_07548 [Pyricularia grisea]